jgi:hypothetical protein
MLLIRRLHGYLGLFIAPSVIFFAFTGALQIFNLHEAHEGYQPPALIRALGSLHKDQVLSEPEHHHGPPSGPVTDGDHVVAPDHDGDHRTRLPTLALKWFFEAVALGLGASTALGLWIGLRVTRTPRLSWGLLAAGALLPVILALL